MLLFNYIYTEKGNNGNGKLPFVFCKQKMGVSFPFVGKRFAVSVKVPIYEY
jgi:hypothetical protein